MKLMIKRFITGAAYGLVGGLIVVGICAAVAFAVINYGALGILASVVALCGLVGGVCAIEAY